MGYQPPSTTTSKYVEDGVDDFADVEDGVDDFADVDWVVFVK